MLRRTSQTLLPPQQFYPDNLGLIAGKLLYHRNSLELYPRASDQKV
jgi:hypothetical protein